MTHVPKVTVIIPVYNGGQSIGDAIESALSQTMDDIEIIVIDDGSTDETASVLAKFEDRITILRQANAGPYVARNAGIARSRGTFVAFLDADDRWLPDKLAAQLTIMETRPEVGLVFCDGRFVDLASRTPRGRLFEANPPAEGDAFDQLLEQNFIPNSAVLVRRTILEQTGPFRTLRLAADWHKWLQIAMRSRIAYVDHVALEFGLHSENISSNPLTMAESQVELFASLVEDAPNAIIRARIRDRFEDASAMAALVTVAVGLRRVRRTLTAAPSRSLIRRWGVIPRAFVRLLRLKRRYARVTRWTPKERSGLDRGSQKPR